MLRMAKPSHPGKFIRTEIIEPMGLSVTDAAKVLGVTRPALSALLNARAALSPEMDREGLRREDGHFDADADLVRNRGGEEERGRDSCSAVQGRREANLEPKLI